MFIKIMCEDPNEWVAPPSVDLSKVAHWSAVVTSIMTLPAGSFNNIFPKVNFKGKAFTLT